LIFGGSPRPGTHASVREFPAEIIGKAVAGIDDPGCSLVITLAAAVSAAILTYGLAGDTPATTSTRNSRVVFLVPIVNRHINCYITKELGEVAA
jgi:hypothetical protein